jgi:hypothetical protein
VPRPRENIPTEVWVLPRPRPDAYVGGFPLHFERKLMRLMGWPAKVLHPFGGLCEYGDSIDLNASTTPTWVGDAHDLHWIKDDTYDLVVLDPPYSDEEAEWLYATPALRPKQYIAEAIRVCRVGGHVALYHRVQPSTPKGENGVPVVKLVHRLVILTRSGHAPRVCFIYEKVAPPLTLDLRA